MPGLHLATSVSLLSSIPEPTAMPHAKRDQYLPIPVDVKTQSTDPLTGSLGLFLVMCGLVLIFVLAVAVFFWRIHVHRRSRLLVSSPDVEQVRENLPLSLPTLLYNPDSNNSQTSVKFPPSLRIRSPIKNKLKFLRISSVNGAVAECAQAPSCAAEPDRILTTDSSATLSLPSIVVSECSPVLPDEDVLGPRDIKPASTSAPSRTSLSSVSSMSAAASSERLGLSGSPQPKVTFDPALKFDGNTKVKRVSVGAGSSDAKTTTKSKSIVRSSLRRGKENTGVVYDMSQLDNRGKPFRVSAAAPLANYKFI